MKANDKSSRCLRVHRRLVVVGWRVLQYAVLDWKARPRMVVYQGRCWLRLGTILGTLGWAGLTGICGAQTKVNLSSPQGTDPVEKAFLSTLQTGRPILLAITSRNSSEPRELWKAMLQTNRARELASAVQLVELVAEDDPARVRQLGVTGTPSLCILRRSQTGIEKVAQQAMPRDPGSLLEWVSWTAGTTATTTKPAVDPAIERTSHPGILTVQPSPQSPQLPVYPVPSAAPAQTLQTIPVVTTPAAPPVAITMSSPPVYIQQGAPTVVLGPAPPPNVVVAQAPLCFPTLSLAAAPVAAPTTINPSPQAQSPAMGAMVSPAQMLCAVPQSTASPAPAPQQSAGLALILSEPNMVDRMIGALGRLLAQRGLPRLQMNPGTPATFTPSLLPLSQAGVPVVQPQPQQLYYAQPPAQAAPPAGPVPSPQQALPVNASPQGVSNPGQPYAQSGASQPFWSKLFHKN